MHSDMKLDQRALQIFASAKLPKTFEIQAATANRPAEMLVYDAIGGDGVTAESVVDALAQIGENDPVRVRINSPGGSAFEGMAIYNALVMHPGHVEVVIDGVAASAASIIAMSGDTVTMNAASMLMIHNSWALSIGNASELRFQANVLDKLDDTMAEVYAKKAGTDVADWSAKMTAETWFTSSEAQMAGLADSIVEPPKKKGIVATVKNWIADLANPHADLPDDTTEDAAATPEESAYDADAETARRRSQLKLRLT